MKKSHSICGMLTSGYSSPTVLDNDSGPTTTTTTMSSSAAAACPTISNWRDVPKQANDDDYQNHEKYRIIINNNTISRVTGSGLVV